MSTNLKLKSRSKRTQSARRLSGHCQLKTCGRRQSRCTRIRKRGAKLSLTKIAEKNVIDVIKPISGSFNSSDNGYSNNLEDINNYSTKISRSESESSLIYVGTTYPNSDMPRKESIIDLTKSDTTVLSQCANTFNLDNYDISGDNILDELHLKDHVSSAASIFTIFPPQPPGLFSSPSDEFCVCRTDKPCCVLSIKRNHSASDVATTSNTQKSKRVASSKSRVSEKISSSDCLWKLKKSYPLYTGLCNNKKEGDVASVENMDIDTNCDYNMFDIVEDFEKKFHNISKSQQALAGELHALKVASNGSNLSSMSNISNVSDLSNV